jgi:exonuclease III
MLHSAWIRYLLMTFLLTFSSILEGYAQQPVVSEDFENLKGFSTAPGIAGKAFDLGPNSSKRLAMAVKNPLKNDNGDFSVTVWVKPHIESREYYEILSALELQVTGQANGWKIAIKPNGSWEFEASKGDCQYKYTTSPGRQTIRNGDWHLLAITYSKISETLTFYYNGEKMAVYYSPGLAGFFTAADLVIGNSPLNKRSFGFLETGWDSFYGWIDDIHLYDQVLPETFIRHYYARLARIPNTKTTNFALKREFLQVTAFNIWKGGNQFGKEAGKKRLIEVMKKLNSDVFLVVETNGSGPEIADALGYQLYLISSNLSIVSRYPITATYAIYKPFHSGGVKISLTGGREINVFCNWLSSQPQYFIAGLTPNESWPLEKYLEEEHKTRVKDIDAILENIDNHAQNADSIPIILGGDFNSGSHLDWTEKTKSLHNNYVVPWPVSIRLQNKGFIDSFREIHPDPLATPGLTWSPIRNFPIKDRIDYIYYKGKDIRAVHSEVTDDYSLGWPSDHSAVTTIFQFNP